MIQQETLIFFKKSVPEHLIPVLEMMCWDGIVEQELTEIMHADQPLKRVDRMDSFIRLQWGDCVGIQMKELALNPRTIQWKWRYN